MRARHANDTTGEGRGEQMIRQSKKQANRVTRGLVVRLISPLVLALACITLASPASALAGTIEWPGGGSTKVEIHPTRVALQSSVAKYLTEVQWRLEYGLTKTGPWTLVSEGTCEYGLRGPGLGIQDFCPPPIPTPAGEIRHLKPGTDYYARFLAESAEGNPEQIIPFTTLPGTKPEFLQVVCESKAGFLYDNMLPQVAGEIHDPSMCVKERQLSLEFSAELDTAGIATEYHFEYITKQAFEESGQKNFEESGGWTVVPGSSGTVSVAEDFAATKNIDLTGLAPGTAYYLRTVASNEKGTSYEPVEFSTRPARPQVAGALDVNGAFDSSAEVEGTVIPDNFETHWRFEYATSEAGPWSVGPEGTIAQAEADEDFHHIKAQLTGLSLDTPYYVRFFAENEYGHAATSSQRFETGGSPLVSTFAVHEIQDESMRGLGFVRPEGHDTRYYFQYVSQAKFDQATNGGFAEASATPEVDIGAGTFEHGAFSATPVGADFPGLAPGVTYHYRVVASSSAPGDPIVYGNERTLTVPVPGSTEAGEEVVSQSETGCPNEALRVGPSAQLPDCRAYEQVTPTQKGGTMDIFNYNVLYPTGSLIGEDGDHFLLHALGVQWGSSPDPTYSNYFFSREQATGWQMTSARPLGEAGPDGYEPELYTPDLTQTALLSEWQTTEASSSPAIEFKAGPPGGPYSTISVPRADVDYNETNGWVAASSDFSKLVLSVKDHTLVPGHTTATTSGSDLYEDDEGQLRQLNVLSDGATIGTCGAEMALGAAEEPDSGARLGRPASTPHAVSADGSRVFFEAAPGSVCAEKHLYMRVAGHETVDIGAYKFFAADSEGSKLLLERPGAGEIEEFFLYETETASLSHLFTASTALEADSTTGNHGGASGVPLASSDLSSVYFASQEQLTSEAPVASGKYSYLYRYDVATRSLAFVTVNLGSPEYVSPDGRYAYFNGDRYDTQENVVQCVTCASPPNPEPLLSARPFAVGEGASDSANRRNDVPQVSAASGNGEFFFFDSPGAYVPQDIDGEEALSAATFDSEYSSSSDVYEWRRNGVDGCARVGGCISLITGGEGGVQNVLLGTTESGRDVFFATHESLVPSDTDTAGDVYDARVGGGIAPPPPRPVECEGDACSTPFAAPSDLTPASVGFRGAGNPASPAVPLATKPKPKSKKPKPKPKKSKAKRGKKKKARKAKKAVRVGNRRGAKS
jgi:hypothetical protein